MISYSVVFMIFVINLLYWMLYWNLMFVFRYPLYLGLHAERKSFCCVFIIYFSYFHSNCIIFLFTFTSFYYLSHSAIELKTFCLFDFDNGENMYDCLCYIISSSLHSSEIFRSKPTLDRKFWWKWDNIVWVFRFHWDFYNVNLRTFTLE